MECPACCSGDRRPLIAGRLSLQRLVIDLPQPAQPWKYEPSECQIGGWRAVSDVGLQGKGSRKRGVLFTDSGTNAATNATTTI